MPRVLIVDDNTRVRAGVRDALAETDQEFAFGEASGGAQAVAACRSEVWDVVILDISMPGYSGVQVLREIRVARPDLPVLMLSFYLDYDHIAEALIAGAAGYIAKERIPEEIATAVSEALAGRQFLSREVADLLSQELGRRRSIKGASQRP